jgi:hypothetical protein
VRVEAIHFMLETNTFRVNGDKQFEVKILRRYTTNILKYRVAATIGSLGYIGVYSIRSLSITIPYLNRAAMSWMLAYRMKALRRTFKLLKKMEMYVRDGEYNMELEEMIAFIDSLGTTVPVSFPHQTVLGKERIRVIFIEAARRMWLVKSVGKVREFLRDEPI